MKTIFILFALMLGTQSFAGGFESCHTDGCDMRRNDQVAAVLNYLRSSALMEQECYGLNSSLLAFKRVTEDSFLIKCGEGPHEKWTFLLKLSENINGDGYSILAVPAKN